MNGSSIEAPVEFRPTAKSTNPATNECDGNGWSRMVHAAIHVANHARRLKRLQSEYRAEQVYLTNPHDMLTSFLAVDISITKLRDHDSLQHFRLKDIGDSAMLFKKDISQAFAAMLCRTGQVKYLTDIHKDIGDRAVSFLGEVMSLKIVSLIGKYLKALIFDPIMGGLVGGMADLLIDIFMLCVVASVTSQLAGPMQSELAHSAGTMMKSALPPILGILLSGSLGVRLSKALVGSLAYAINSFLDEEVAGAMSGSMIHQLSHTITNSITTSLNFGMTQSLTHTLSTSLSHSVTHYFYCTYCYYFGDYCNYCYYYQDFKWMHK
jgi:hypothetical protein